MRSGDEAGKVRRLRGAADGGSEVRVDEEICKSTKVVGDRNPEKSHVLQSDLSRRRCRLRQRREHPVRRRYLASTFGVRRSVDGTRCTAVAGRRGVVVA